MWYISTAHDRCMIRLILVGLCIGVGYWGGIGQRCGLLGGDRSEVCVIGGGIGQRCVLFGCIFYLAVWSGILGPSPNLLKGHVSACSLKRGGWWVLLLAFSFSASLIWQSVARNCRGVCVDWKKCLLFWGWSDKALWLLWGCLCSALPLAF